MLNESRGKTEERILPEEERLLEAFHKAIDATRTPPGLTIDVDAVASKAIQAYWKARDENESESVPRLKSPIELPFIRYDVVKAVWARIDPAWEFFRELLSASMPTLAVVIFTVVVYYASQRGFSILSRRFFTEWDYLISLVFGIAAAILMALFIFKRGWFLSSKYRILQTSSGALVGGLIGATVASILGVALLMQKTRARTFEEQVEQYAEAIELNTAVEEMQPIAAATLSLHDPSPSAFQHVVESHLRGSALAKSAHITKISSDSHQVIYEVVFRGYDRSRDPLIAKFSPDKVEISSQFKPGYAIWQSVINDVKDDTITLAALPEVSKGKPFRLPILAILTSEVQNDYSEILGKRVLVTYDLNLNRPVNVTLVDRFFLSDIYVDESLHQVIPSQRSKLTPRTQ